MRQRCNNPNAKAFKDYGGRGIRICDDWNASFDAFLRDMGPRPDGTELDRIDNDGHYEPGNCRWATRGEQQNNRRVNRYITYNDETLTVAQWAKRTGIHRNTLDQRIAAGLTIEEVLSLEKRHNTVGIFLAAQKSKVARLARTHCKHGHPWDAENTSYTPSGGRVCRACHRIRQNTRRYAERLKGPS